MARKRATPANEPPEGRGELRGSADMDVATISGATFTNKSVTYYAVDGIAIVEGDIALGTVEEVKKRHRGRPRGAGRRPARRVRRRHHRQPVSVAELPDPVRDRSRPPNQQRVTDAIAHWEANTPFRFPLRTAANAGQYPNYVRFTDAGGCWSMVGMQGGQQTISLGAGCTHGQRHPRDRPRRGPVARAEPRGPRPLRHHQLAEHPDRDGAQLQPAHHRRRRPRRRTTTARSCTTRGRRSPRTGRTRSCRPIRTRRSGSETACRPATSPPSRRCIRDAAWSRQPWTEPGGHFKKLFDDPRPFKKVRDDGRFKKLRDDDLVVKALRDPKGPRDPGPIKMAYDPMLPFWRREIGTQPGTLQPFSIATPHHAAGLDEGAVDAGSVSYLASLQRQLLELEAAIAEAHATAAQANADVARLQEASDAVTSAYSEALDDLGGGACRALLGDPRRLPSGRRPCGRGAGRARPRRAPAVLVDTAEFPQQRGADRAVRCRARRATTSWSEQASISRPAVSRGGGGPAVHAPCGDRARVGIVHVHGVSRGRRRVVGVARPHLGQPTRARRDGPPQAVPVGGGTEVGLPTPRTVITNDPAEARRFVDELGPERTVYKTFLASEDTGARPGCSTSASWPCSTGCGSLR